MSHPLDRCWAKIERANESIQNLEAEISAFVQPDRYLIAGNVNHQTKECTFVADAKAIALRFSVLAGEIIHHLRSSLDHLVWALCQRHISYGSKSPKTLKKGCRDGPAIPRFRIRSILVLTYAASSAVNSYIYSSDHPA